ncbi:MAG TPA: HAMP domain-containing protein, partial [Candidatus Rifleibacterium sp.]|nr:HAMP domain-containing protein [Candidatus Rifleibacterium sp.]
MLSISKKIFSGFGFVLLICIGVSGLAGYNMLKLRDMIDYLKGNYTTAMLNSQELMANVHLSATSITELIRSLRNRDESISFYNSAKESAFARLENIDANLKDPFLKDAPNVIAFKQTTESNLFELFDLCDNYLMLQAGQDLNPASVTELLTAIRDKEIELTSKCRGLCETLSNYSRQMTQKNVSSMFDIMGYVVKLLPVVMLVFGFGFTMFISNGISRPLEKIVSSMSEAEKGHLNTRLSFDSHDEFQRVA